MPTKLSATERSRVLTRAQLGMDSPGVTVETHLPGGLPGFTLVGLPETAVREARDRVRSALSNCGYDVPSGRIVVNLAPADLVKEGARYDLAIAISILAATGQIPHRRLQQFEFLGELGLAGELRATRGSLCAALALLEAEDPISKRAQAHDYPGPLRPVATKLHRKRLIMPAASASETDLAQHAVIPLNHLTEVIDLLRGNSPPSRKRAPSTPPSTEDPPDEILGQVAAKRALLVAAAGGHHLLMVGPPGTGKTLLSRRLAALLPPLSERAALEVAAVYSAGGLVRSNAFQAPFRDPHHSASAPALVGGGSLPRPGEISLAHHGVLFLDELPHFKPSVLDHLREPLETRSISLARSRARARFPARFQLIAAMNPCPAGRACDPTDADAGCRCNPEQARRYRGRLSGPLLDRIDLHVGVPPVPKTLLIGQKAAVDCLEDPRTAVAAARDRQLRRQGVLNVDLPSQALHQHCALDPSGRDLLERAMDGYRLSARGVHRVLRVARSVADLEERDSIGTAQLREALGYRALDWDAPRLAITAG